MGVLKRHERYQKRCKTTRVQRNISPKAIIFMSSTSTSKSASSVSSNNIASCNRQYIPYKSYKYGTAQSPTRPDTDVACVAHPPFYIQATPISSLA